MSKATRYAVAGGLLALYLGMLVWVVLKHDRESMLSLLLVLPAATAGLFFERRGGCGGKKRRCCRSETQ